MSTGLASAKRKRVCAVLVGLLVAITPVSAAEPAYDLRWIWCMHNLQVKEQADAVIGIIERAAKVGYNGVVLADYKFNVLDRVPDYYFTNVARVRKAAAEHHVELIPTVFPIGYSAGLLAHDPNLAEGVPVRDAPFVVKGNEAMLDPRPAARIANGGLEETKGDRFTGFSFQDDPGRTTFADREVHHGGNVACRMQDIGKGTSGNCRLIQRVKVRPHACYRFSAWVKTRDLKPTGGFKLLVTGGKAGRPLSFLEDGLTGKATQDWHPVEVVFNSLAESEVNLYAGQWGGKSGTAWVDDLALEELSLVSVLRRPGCPISVTSADGVTLYEEGKDYLPIRDEGLGMRPYAGQYDFRHPGARLRLAEGSRIRAGVRLCVSWYHPIIVHGEQITCCVAEPKVYDLLRDQARRVHKLLAPKTYFMSHDEIRVMGWCQACRASGKTPGELLADNAHRCVAILKEVDPEARIVVWSDMFDPYHNAVDKYYLVNGSWADSWKGLPKDVIIANWNGGKPAQSLKFFADLGHRQIIAGYYDSDVGDLRRWQEAASGVPGVRGVMYTTWSARYGDLEAFSRLFTAKE